LGDGERQLLRQFQQLFRNVFEYSVADFYEGIDFAEIDVHAAFVVYDSQVFKIAHYVAITIQFFEIATVWGIWGEKIGKLKRSARYRAQ
jgi:hypothetical protein